MNWLWNELLLDTFHHYIRIPDPQNDRSHNFLPLVNKTNLVKFVMKKEKDREFALTLFSPSLSDSYTATRQLTEEDETLYGVNPAGHFVPYKYKGNAIDQEANKNADSFAEASEVE